MRFMQCWNVLSIYSVRKHGLHVLLLFFVCLFVCLFVL